MTQPNGPVIFLSHSSEDVTAADALMRALVRGGVPGSWIFYSSGRGTGIRVGREIRSSLHASLAEARLLVALLSPGFFTSRYCPAEYAAVDYRLKQGDNVGLFPIVLPPLTRAEAVGWVGEVQMPVLRARELDGLMEDLRRAVNDATGLGITAERWAGALAEMRAAVAPPEPGGVADARFVHDEVQSGPVWAGGFRLVEDPAFTEVHGEVETGRAATDVAVRVTFHDAAGTVLRTGWGTVPGAGPGVRRPFRVRLDPLVGSFSRVGVRIVRE